MEIMLAPQRTTSKAVLVAAFVGVAGLIAAGCGSKAYHNTLRPPAPIVVTAAISPDRVSVSPRTFGAGPISLIVTNQTSATQQITLETSKTAAGAGITQQTGPINPSDTATLKADVPQGTYEVHVQGAAIKPARIVVGTKRPSSQNDVLLP
jgi:hypothetical protein